MTNQEGERHAPQDIGRAIRSRPALLTLPFMEASLANARRLQVAFVVLLAVCVGALRVR